MPLLILLLMALATAPVAAQWSISARVARTETSGYVESNIGTNFLPHAPHEYTLSVGRTFGPWELRLGGRHIDAGLAAASEEFILVSRDAIDGTGATLEVLRRIAGSESRTSLHAALGAELIRWTLPGLGGENTTKIAVLGAIEGSVPVGGQWRALLRGELTAGSSIFAGEDFGDDLVRRTGIRHGIGVGIARRW